MLHCKYNLLRLFVIVFVCYFIFISGCVESKSTRTQTTLPSPSGARDVIVGINYDKNKSRDTYLCLMLSIRHTGKKEYEAQTYASDRMKWTIEWKGDKELILNSSDVGTYTWKYDDNTGWKLTNKDMKLAWEWSLWRPSDK